MNADLDMPTLVYTPSITTTQLRDRISDLSERIADAKVEWNARYAEQCASRTEEARIASEMAFRKYVQLKSDLVYVLTFAVSKTA